METTCLDIESFGEEHSISVESKNGYRYSISICKDGRGNYKSNVIFHENTSTTKDNWEYSVLPASTSIEDNFKSSIEQIQKHLSSADPKDAILDIHNSCNCPFISEPQQNNVLKRMGVSLKVRVN